MCMRSLLNCYLVKNDKHGLRWRHMCTFILPGHKYPKYGNINATVVCDDNSIPVTGLGTAPLVLTRRWVRLSRQQLMKTVLTQQSTRATMPLLLWTPQRVILLRTHATRWLRRCNWPWSARDLWLTASSFWRSKIDSCFGVTSYSWRDGIKPVIHRLPG